MLRVFFMYCLVEHLIVKSDNVIQALQKLLTVFADLLFPSLFSPVKSSSSSSSFSPEIKQNHRIFIRNIQLRMLKLRDKKQRKFKTRTVSQLTKDTLSHTNNNLAFYGPELSSFVYILMLYRPELSSVVYILMLYRPELSSFVYILMLYTPELSSFVYILMLYTPEDVHKGGCTQRRITLVYTT